MTDTPKRLCGPAALPIAAATQYTVPALTTTIVRSIHIANTSSSVTATFVLAIGTAAQNVALFYLYPLPAASVLDWSGFIVLNAGEILTGSATQTTMTLTVNGIEVT